MTEFIFSIKSTITDLKSAVKETVKDENRILMKENAKKGRGGESISERNECGATVCLRHGKKEEEV